MSSNEWKDVNLSDICTIRRGSSPRPIQKYLADKGMPWVKIADATASSSRYINKTKEFIKIEGISKSVIVKPGTLILSNSATPGLPKFMGIEACVHDGWLILSEFKEVLPEFMYYQLLKIRSSLVNNATGTVFQNLNIDIVKKFEIKIPPKDQQKKIAETLSSLDEKIDINNQINKNLEEIAQAIYKSWFVNFEPFQDGEFEESIIGLIPKGWKIIKLADEVNFERGVEPGSKNYENILANGYMPFYRVGDMLSKTNTYVNIDLIKGKMLSENDIIVSFDGTPGRVVCGLYGSYSTGIRKVYSKERLNLPNTFLYSLMKSEYIQEIIRRYSEGSTILHASNSIKFMQIAYDEDSIRKFNNIIAPILSLIIDNKKTISKLTTIRDELLPKLMSGEIRVPIEEVQ